jgi:hypothetical protein
MMKEFESPSDLRKSTAAGRLQERSSRVLIQNLHQIRFSGSLSLQHKEKKKKLWFNRGEIIRIQSNLSPELLGNMLVDRGILTEEELKSCLSIQRQMIEKGQPRRKLGEIAQGVRSVSIQDLNELCEIQKINSILQSMTWNEGTYELMAFDVKSSQTSLLSLREMVESIEMLFDPAAEGLGPLFQVVRPWHPRTQAIDLGRTPLWSIIAGCLHTGVSGILSIRKQNKLYEIVVKHGQPLLLYEGTFGQPRQMVIVRQTSEEHEKFFVDQVFKLFSFLTGSAHFRMLGGIVAEPDRESDIVVLEEDSSDRAIDLTDDKTEPRTKVVGGGSLDAQQLIVLDSETETGQSQKGFIQKTLDQIFSFKKKSA